MHYKRNFLIAIGVFLLIILFFILGLVLQGPYEAVTKPYFNFLNKTGYYEHVYQPDCHRRCFFGNLPHNAPYIFVMMVVIGSLATIYYYLSDDKKALRKYFKSVFTSSVESSEAIQPTDINNKKHKSLFQGIITAFFLLIGIFFVLPLVVVFWSSMFVFDKVDRCLDGGGRWNYDTKICEMDITNDIFDPKNYPPPDARYVEVNYVDLVGLGTKEEILTYTQNSASPGNKCIVLLNNQVVAKRVDYMSCSASLTRYSEPHSVVTRPSWLQSMSAIDTSTTSLQLAQDITVVKLGGARAIRKQLLVRSTYYQNGEFDVQMGYKLIAFVDGTFKSVSAPNRDYAHYLNIDKGERAILLTNVELNVEPTGNGITEEYSIFCEKDINNNIRTKRYEKACRTLTFNLVYKSGALVQK